MARSYICSRILITLLVILAPAACKNSHDYSGTMPQIDDQHSVIMLKASAGGMTDVKFSHRSHARSYDNTCMVCHSHTSVSNNSVWSCTSCHAANDAQGLCGSGSNGHACMSLQCLRCHEKLAKNPTPGCYDCHIILLSGVLVDAAVKGLDYTTETQRGSTDSAGKFAYLSGEIVTFSLGGLEIGRSIGRPVLTLIDLVNGAMDETDQTVSNIGSFLQTLDTNSNPDDGIDIPFGAWETVWGRTLSFNTTTAAFQQDPALLSILNDLRSNGVYSGETTTRTLVDASLAQTHMRATIDTLFPPATDVQIAGIPNTNVILSGSYVSSSQTQSYYLAWYRADDESGTGRSVISGASASSYQPSSGDLYKYVAFEATPDTGCAAPGTAVQSAWSGPVTATPLDRIAFNVRLTGRPNTNFILAGSYETNMLNQPYLYRWYRADDSVGTNKAVISGATTTLYQPAAPTDVGKWIAFEVSPDDGGGIPGTPNRSAWRGPISSSATHTVYSTLSTTTQVDRYLIGLRTTGTVIINVESYESWNESCAMSTDYNCASCHMINQIPSNLGLTAKCGNDKLVANFYLFSYSGGSPVGLVASKTGIDPCPGAGGLTGYPGCDAPGAFVTRSEFNPYFSGQIAAGDYVFAIGAQGLTEADARSGTNTGGTAYFTRRLETYHADTSRQPMYYGSRYRVTFTFP